VHILDQALQQAQGRFNRPLAALMHTMLQIARNGGAMDLALALNVRRWARLAKWRASPLPPVLMPWLKVIRSYPVQYGTRTATGQTYHPQALLYTAVDYPELEVN